MNQNIKKPVVRKKKIQRKVNVHKKTTFKTVNLSSFTAEKRRELSEWL